MEALVAQGFRVVPVEEQMKPDGQFPNVTQTPNPEVPVSMDRAVETAKRESADLVLSTDPDADRLGSMAPYSDQQWRFITGNEIAALLTHFKLTKLSEQGRLPASPIVVKTGVTTSLVTRIARHLRAQVVEDLLVGFKYIADVIWHLEQSGGFEDVRGTPADFVIGCEESHGILVTPQIRDKDAAGAAVLLAELALDQKRRGRSVVAYLDELARQFGYFRNEVVPVVMSGIEGKQNMARMMDRLRASPPKVIGDQPVTRVEDLRDENGPFGPVKGATDLAARNVLIFHLGAGGRITLRPSGTEPKAKAYVEVCSAPGASGTSADAWQRTCRDIDQLVLRLATDFLQQSLALVGLPMPKEGVRLSR